MSIRGGCHWRWQGNDHQQYFPLHLPRHHYPPYYHHQNHCHHNFYHLSPKLLRLEYWKPFYDWAGKKLDLRKRSYDRLLSNNKTFNRNVLLRLSVNHMMQLNIMLTYKREVAGPLTPNFPKYACLKLTCVQSAFLCTLL